MKARARFIYHNFPLTLGALLSVLLISIVCLSVDYSIGIWGAVGFFIGALIGDTVKYLAIKNNWP